jgi:hypothetical protein
VGELIEKADVNVEGGLYNTALGAALEGGDDDLAMLLLSKGADPEQKRGSLLQRCMCIGLLRPA